MAWVIKKWGNKKTAKTYDDGHESLITKSEHLYSHNNINIDVYVSTLL